MMCRSLLAVVAALALPVMAQAGPGATEACYAPDATTAVIDTLALTSDRVFTFTQANSTSVTGYYKTMEVYVTLVDANTSITSLTMTCTGSTDNNATDYTPKQCTTTAGTTTCSSAGVWPFTSPGSASWHFSVDIHAVQDTECTWHVATGSAASIDTIHVKRVLCAQ